MGSAHLAYKRANRWGYLIESVKLHVRTCYVLSPNNSGKLSLMQTEKYFYTDKEVFNQVMDKPKWGRAVQAVLLISVVMFASLELLGCAKKVTPVVKPPKKIKEPVVKEPKPAPLKPVKKPTPPKPTPPPPPPKEPVKPKRIPPVEFIESNYETIHFEYDKSRLLPESRKKLEKNAELIRKSLKKHPGFKLLIDGHCDERGTNEYNLALGERRAFSARDYLLSLGIPTNILYTKSWGEEKPIDPGHNEKAWAKNRRAEFHVYKGE